MSTMLEIGVACPGKLIWVPDWNFQYLRSMTYFIVTFCRKRRLSVNTNLQMVYPTFGLAVETLHELKIQASGSYLLWFIPISIIRTNKLAITHNLWTNKAIRIERNWWFVDSKYSIIIWTNKSTTGLVLKMICH